MKKPQSLSFEESLTKIDELKLKLSIENQKRLNEILGKIPKKLGEESKKKISEYTNGLISEILFFGRLYNKTETSELNGVIQEVIISFRYNVKHSLDKK